MIKKINAIEIYVLHYTPSIPQQAILSKQFLSKAPTEFQYIEKPVLVKEVMTQKFWTFELRTQEVFKLSKKNFCWFSAKK